MGLSEMPDLDDSDTTADGGAPDDGTTPGSPSDAEPCAEAT